MRYGHRSVDTRYRTEKGDGNTYLVWDDTGGAVIFVTPNHLASARVADALNAVYDEWVTTGVVRNHWGVNRIDSYGADAAAVAGDPRWRVECGAGRWVGSYHDAGAASDVATALNSEVRKWCEEARDDEEEEEPLDFDADEDGDDEYDDAWEFLGDLADGRGRVDGVTATAYEAPFARATRREAYPDDDEDFGGLEVWKFEVNVLGATSFLTVLLLPEEVKPYLLRLSVQAENLAGIQKAMVENDRLLSETRPGL